MKRLNKWSLILGTVLVLLLTSVAVYVALAQPPAKAPVPPEEAGGPRGRLMAPEREAEARERAEALRKMWQDRTLLSGRANASMAVAGGSVYILYGPYLCQFSAEGLQLKAKVDLREVLKLDKQRLQKEVRKRVRRITAEAEAEAQAKEPAEE